MNSSRGHDTLAEKIAQGEMAASREELVVRVERAGDEASAGALARRAALSHGFSSKRAWAVNIVARELATNLWRHGGGGSLRVRASPAKLELVSEDAGPGLAMEDPLPGPDGGAGVANVRGHGLEAIHRFAEIISICRRTGGGLAVTVIMRPQGAR